MAEEENQPLNVNDYNSEEGKLVASIRWLINRVYETADVPDRLRELFVRDEKNSLHLTSTVTTILVNGSLYTQAASKILRDPTLITKTVGAVLKALSTADIEVRDAEGSLITEELLTSIEPLQLSTHLSLIDALMAAHMKSIVSIDRVVQAVSVYTSVDKREEPLDCVDALLFWINKICLLVRDDVEREGIALKGSENGLETTIPEMEDLYEDLCDGTCISALVAFYRPHEVDLRDINFNDPISISDCRYNLGILKNFCETCLPWNIFHFEIDDILVLHESLQSNVNAFLADLFFFFEPVPEPSPQATSPTQRRFVPIQGIPELRAQNVAHRPLHPPKTNRNSYGNSQRTMSMASADSLMTGRSGDSLRYNTSKPSALPPGTATTNFGDLNTENSVNNETSNPASNLKAYTEMRLAFEEKRREHERKSALNSALKEEERLKLGKNAFFKLMSRNTAADSSQTATSPEHIQRPYEGASTARELELSAQLEDIREELKNLKVMQQQQSMSNLTNVGVSHATSQPSLYSELYNQQQTQYPSANYPASPYGTLPHKSPHAYALDPLNSARNPYGMYPAGSAGQQTFFPSQLGENPQHHYAMPNTSYGAQNIPPYYQQSPPGYQLQPSNSHGALHLAAQQQALQQQQQHYAQQMPPVPAHYPANPMSYSMYEPYQVNGAELMNSPAHQAPDSYAQSVPNANSFRLHQPYAATSRLDPALEINRNFTNWGLTYKAERPQRKTWATFDDTTDTTTSEIPQNPQHRPSNTNGNTPLEETKSSLNSSLLNEKSNGNASKELNQSVHQSPPRDPDFHSHNEISSSTTTFPANSTTSSHFEASKANGGLVITEGSEPTAEMEARRQALLMSQMKRKEKISAAKEDKRDEWDEKKEEEARKQEMAEQRKLERELKRQKLLEDYKRKKMEQELGESMNGSLSARASVSSTGSLVGVNRGRSQPPFSRPKSQSNMSAIQIQNLQRPNRTKSSVADENSAPRINVPALADPSSLAFLDISNESSLAYKLYAKHKLKSNRPLIMNALQYSVFPGAVSNDQRNKVQAALAQSDSKHFLLLFRDQRSQYRGLYTWDQQSDTIYRIDGAGPKIVKEEMMQQMFKYDSGNKHFNHIPTKHLSATIDGFTLLDHFWNKPKIPHSRGV
ncbi:Patronin [Aphelenchoides besseyi]|nr:Patronin [Aphelenchoides besseyi]